MNGWDMLQNALIVAFATAVLGWMVGGLRRETRRAWEGLRAEMREEIGGVRGELTGLRAEMREEIGGVRGELTGLRAEMREEIGGVRSDTHDELRALRSDLTQVALALGVRPRAGNE